MSTIKANQWLNTDGTENFKCRAWVNFNGTGTVAIRASGNVSSITDNGVGSFTVNFTTTMPDNSYTKIISSSLNYSVNPSCIGVDTMAGNESIPTISSFTFFIQMINSAAFDPKYINVAVFR